MAPPEAAVAIARNVRDRIDLGPPHHAGDQLGRDRRQITTPALLPGGDKDARMRLVDERGARAAEREPPAAALGAATHGPRARCTTSLAPWWGAAHEESKARLARRFTDPAAHAATAREQEIQKMMHRNRR